tara:strand:- start:3729 stop:3932 length:204 start_codon:yes stop_codon:yes gene_type:complete
MKYKDYPNKVALCKYILSELDRTIESMGPDGVYSDLDMFRYRARKADLVKKRKEINKKLNRYVKKDI